MSLSCWRVTVADIEVIGSCLPLATAWLLAAGQGAVCESASVPGIPRADAEQPHQGASLILFCSRSGAVLTVDFVFQKDSELFIGVY